MTLPDVHTCRKSISFYKNDEHLQCCNYTIKKLSNSKQKLEDNICKKPKQKILNNKQLLLNKK